MGNSWNWWNNGADVVKKENILVFRLFSSLHNKHESLKSQREQQQQRSKRTVNESTLESCSVRRSTGLISENPIYSAEQETRSFCWIQTSHCAAASPRHRDTRENHLSASTPLSFHRFKVTSSTAEKIAQTWEEEMKRCAKVHEWRNGSKYWIVSMPWWRQDA